MTDRILPVHYTPQRYETIHPFIMSPTSYKQTTFILAPVELTSMEKQIKENLLVKGSMEKGKSVVQLFRIMDFLFVTVTFFSDVPEIHTGRQGLGLSFGIAINKNTLCQLPLFAPSACLKIMISMFRTMGLDLYQGDTDKLVSFIQENRNIHYVISVFKDILDVHASMFYSTPPRCISKARKHYRTNHKLTPPALILGFGQVSEEIFIRYSLDIVDSMLYRSFTGRHAFSCFHDFTTTSLFKFSEMELPSNVITQISQINLVHKEDIVFLKIY